MTSTKQTPRSLELAVNAGISRGLVDTAMRYLAAKEAYHSEMRAAMMRAARAVYDRYGMLPWPERGELERIVDDLLSEDVLDEVGAGHIPPSGRVQTGTEESPPSLEARAKSPGSDQATRERAMPAPASISRQALKQKRNMAKGLCRACSRPRCPESTSFCYKHLLKHRVDRRRKLGSKQWRPGTRGRPPSETKKKEVHS